MVGVSAFVHCTFKVHHFLYYVNIEMVENNGFISSLSVASLSWKMYNKLSKKRQVKASYGKHVQSKQSVDRSIPAI